jgi:hypothetical protein
MCCKATFLLGALFSFVVTTSHGMEEKNNKIDKSKHRARRFLLKDKALRVQRYKASPKKDENILSDSEKNHLVNVAIETKMVNVPSPKIKQVNNASVINVVSPKIKANNEENSNPRVVNNIIEKTKNFLSIFDTFSLEQAQRKTIDFAAGDCADLIGSDDESLTTMDLSLFVDQTQDAIADTTSDAEGRMLDKIRKDNKREAKELQAKSKKEKKNNNKKD